MKDLLCQPQDCVLCMACANICPKDAIYIDTDEYGYEKIAVDDEKCVNCELCTKACNRRKDITHNVPIVSYAAQAANYDALAKSASGGAFQMIAESVLERGGVCYGCTFSKQGDYFSAKHVRIDSLDNLPLILNTKYVPSIIGNAFSEVLQDLLTDKVVLFSGTPCQVQGLKAFLGKEYPNLLTVDLICHGIASTKLFNDCLEQIEIDNNIKILDYSFRDKSISWGTNFSYSYYKTNDDKKRKYLKHCPREESSYTIYYLQAEILRENCYSCTLSNTNRVSDFTLGDYWGIEEEHPEYITGTKSRMVLRRGISCILVNTERAVSFVDNFKDKMIMHQVNLESIVEHNGNLRNPSGRGSKREQLLQTYKEFGYAPIEEAYRNSVRKKRKIYNIKNFLKSYLPDWLRICIYRSPALRRIVFH